MWKICETIKNKQTVQQQVKTPGDFMEGIGWNVPVQLEQREREWLWQQKESFLTTEVVWLILLMTEVLHKLVIVYEFCLIKN